MKAVSPAFFVILILTSCTKSGEVDNANQPDVANPPPPAFDTSKWHVTEGFGDVMNFYFLDAATGFYAGSGGIGRTADSGKTWLPVATGEKGQDVFFTDRRHGYFVAENTFGVTDDGGITWTKKDLAPYDLKRVFFINKDTGFITSRDGLFKTTDQGNHWTRQFNSNVTGIYFMDEKRGWVSMGSSSSLVQTIDGGQSFKSFPVSHVYTIAFTDSLHGWTNNTSEFSMLKTSDGGVTWRRVPIQGRTIDLHFINNNVGFVCTDGGILKSTDGGETWSQFLKLPSDVAVIEVYFVDENNGWAADSKNRLYRYHN